MAHFCSGTCVLGAKRRVSQLPLARSPERSKAQAERMAGAGREELKRARGKL